MLGQGSERMKGERKRALVVTWFYDNQPGYLDFCYRINELSTHYDVTVISRIDSTENYNRDIKTIIIGVRQSSKIDLFKYYLRVIDFVRKESFSFVLLLGTQISTLSLLFRNIRTYVYWNVHPSQFINIASSNLFKKFINKLYYRAQYLAAKKCTLVMPIGEFHLEDLVINGVPEENLKMLYMGVGQNFYLSRKSEPASLLSTTSLNRRIKVVYAGSVSVERGRDVMLGAVKIFNQRYPGEILLSIIGAGTEELAYCNKFAIDNKLTDCLKIMGRVSGDLIPGLIAESDFGLCLMEDLTWSRVSPPTKLFEYQAAGLPVLCSDIRTHTLYVSDNINGLVFDYSVNGLYECFVRCLCSKDEYGNLASNSISASDKFNWQHIKNDFINVFNER